MTTKSNQLRVMMLERPDLFDAIRLTASQRKAVGWVRGHGQPAASNAVAVHLGISLNHASLTLKACHDKGYLTRVNIGDPTGGKQWAYSYALEVVKCT